MILHGGAMRKIFCVILALSLVGSALFAGNPTSLDEAKSISAKTNKPILIDFFTEW